MLNNTLIENALNLTGKTMEEFQEYHMSWPIWSIERFCYYLLSPEFIEKYDELPIPKIYGSLTASFWYAIYEYQLNNPEPLNNLLQKIVANQS